MTGTLPHRVVQCAANFSEGRDVTIVHRIAEAAAGAECVVADWSADPDHNRMVLSLLGSPEGVREGALRSASVAVESIDLRRHRGVHPRIGAVDVVPFTPVRGVTLSDCVAIARQFAVALSRQCGVPVYFYEAAAAAGRPTSLPDIRRLAHDRSGTLPPDLTPEHAVAGAGAAVVGARMPLVAFNVDLATAEVGPARAIAARIRRERNTAPELAGVRALGLFLPSRQRAQVSMNLTRPERTPLPAVFDYVAAAARELALDVDASEVIGLLPAASLAGHPPERICLRGMQETQIVEYWTEGRQAGRTNGPRIENDPLRK